MPAIPSWTVAGAFGIARTTGTPSAMRSSMCAVVIAAATETTVCSGVRLGPISARSAVDVLRLDGDDDDRRADGGRNVVVAAPGDDDLRTRRASRR